MQFLMGRIEELEKHGSSATEQKLHRLKKIDNFFARDSNAPLWNISEKLPTRESIG